MEAAKILFNIPLEWSPLLGNLNCLVTHVVLFMGTFSNGVGTGNFNSVPAYAYIHESRPMNLTLEVWWDPYKLRPSHRYPLLPCGPNWAPTHNSPPQDRLLKKASIYIYFVIGKLETQPMSNLGTQSPNSNPAQVPSGFKNLE